MMDKHRKKVLNSYDERGLTGEMPDRTFILFVALALICIGALGCLMWFVYTTYIG